MSLTATKGRSPQPGTPVKRVGGYAPISDYAAVGDGRAVALVARDGSIDWLCLPDLDSPSVFAAVLDAERGGSFRLKPTVPFRVSRRYLSETNVLQTTFHTAEGSVCVTDAMTLPLAGVAPAREIARQVEGLAGAVPMRWSAEPRFDYGRARTRLGWRGPIPVATSGQRALAFCSWGAGEPEIAGGAIEATFSIKAGEEALLAMSVAHGDPLVFPPRGEVLTRLRASAAYWRKWVDNRHYEGPWRDSVLRSALALKLLIFAPSGAVSAAPTSSLPEAIGGTRNWDYRYCWIRDASATLAALMRLGCPAEGEAFFWWLMHASQLTHPRLQVLYQLTGGSHAPERELELAGYRHSRPVRVGNGAVKQEQLDTYGHLLHTAWLYADAGGALSGDAAKRLARTVDLVCDRWRDPDSGIWEVRSSPRHFTQSKMMCWIALDRAERLAESGAIPGDNAATWRREAGDLRRFVHERCWSERRKSYVRAPGMEEADASLLLPAILGYGGVEEKKRLAQTTTWIREQLGAGALLYRYRGEDGVAGSEDEGAFLTCSFWLVEALARLGQSAEATELMDELVSRSNDVGLYAEEIDPRNDEFVGNFPQGLVHLALINAAATLAEGRTG
ncbi:MAG: glycoside hydrolase family 15 protein [Solirubrobacterales bacterium]